MKTVTHYMVRDRWTTRAVEWVLYAMAWVGRWATWPLGTWTLGGAFAWIGGHVVLAIPGFRRRAERNLDLVWPDLAPQARRQIIRAAGAQFARTMIEYARLDRCVREWQLSVEGIEHLQAARNAGKGAVLVTAHYGNWEAARLAAKQAGCESGIIYRSFNNRYLDRYTLDLIRCVGEPVLQKGRQGMRSLITHVAGGGVAMILVDQRNSGAPYLDFLGQPAETVTVAADLARRSGAAFIPVRAIREAEHQRFRVIFEAPIPVEAAEPAMQAVNDRISAWIEEYPDQWFWFHRRWKTTIRSRPRPEG
ncbi:MAG: hypothetical protein AAGK00_18060 [Pseudomonadota bacterium]